MSAQCPFDPDSNAIGHFLRGNYCERCSGFDEERFLANWHPVYFVALSFIQRFNFREFKELRDPVLAMIGSEIWLYNIGRLLEREGVGEITELLSCDERRRELLPKCNTHSLAQYFELPYQTVRRKVQILVDKGIVEKNGKGELCISNAGEASFATLNLETVRDLVSSARCVFAMLGLDPNRLSLPRKD